MAYYVTVKNYYQQITAVCRYITGEITRGIDHVNMLLLWLLHAVNQSANIQIDLQDV